MCIINDCFIALRDEQATPPANLIFLDFFSNDLRSSCFHAISTIFYSLDSSFANRKFICNLFWDNVWGVWIYNFMLFIDNDHLIVVKYEPHPSLFVNQIFF